MKWSLLILGFFLLFKVSAQDINSINWDIDSLFDEPSASSSVEEFVPDADIYTDTDGFTVLQMINRRSLTFEASYKFAAGLFPAWAESPWEDGDGDNAFYWNPGAKLSSAFVLDAQISQSFRVLSSFNFSIPDTIQANAGAAGYGFRFNLGDFFFDYNLFDIVFFRGGKYSLKWGISPNFPFTNLLARVPSSSGFTYDSLILKADIPFGVGGFQILTLTRTNIFDSASFEIEKVGIGGKYNLALRQFDLDAGVFYQYGMPFRGFVSLKTTLGNTEVYSEALVAVADFNKLLYSSSGAFNIGFVHEFFNNKLTINGEFFFNNEKDSYIYEQVTDLLDAKTSPFINGFNMALNLRYRPGGYGDPNFYLQALYEGLENSARIIPALSLNILSNINVYLAFPITLGSKNGYYYKNTITETRDGVPLRFAAVLLVSLSGEVRYTVYP